MKSREEYTIYLKMACIDFGVQQGYVNKELY